MERAKIEARKRSSRLRDVVAEVVTGLPLEEFFLEAAQRCGVDIVRLCDEVEAEEVDKPLKYLRELQAVG
jgi:hypothetical protein